MTKPCGRSFCKQQSVVVAVVVVVVASIFRT